MGNILNIIDSRNDFNNVDGLLPLQCGPFFNNELDFRFEYKFCNLDDIDNSTNYFYVVEIAQNSGITNVIPEILKVDKLVDLINNDRCKVYVNGSDLDQFNSSVSQNTDVTFFISGQQFWVGRNKGNGYGFDGYMADVIYVDGQQLLPTAFGETKADPDGNDVWIPVDYAGTYGNNGFRLEFKQNGTGANSSGIGADTSGNDHHFSLNGIGADHQVTDSPTFGGD